MADVFVSYSRRDSEFVSRLTESIEGQGKKVWVDTEGIADAEVFPEAIKRAIEQSDAFLFVITPASVDSSYCENEVEYAKEMQKRIVPVLREPVPDDRLHEDIRDRNWIPFTDDEQFDPSMGRLVKALDTDLDAAKSHTRWLVKALEWEAEGRDKSFLLRGAELKSAEGRLAASPENAEPAPTSLQREYLLASREAAARRQRMLVGASLAIAVVSIGLLIFALISRGQAVSAQGKAVSEQISARSQALSAESQAQLPNDPEISLILGMRAVKEKPTAQSLFALRAALDSSPLERALPTVAAPGSCGLNSGLSAAVSPDGRQIAEGACNGGLLLLEAATGRIVHTLHLPPVESVAYSPDGSLLAVGTNSKVVLVNPRTGAVVAQSGTVFPASLGGPGVTAVAFSPNGRELAANGTKGPEIFGVPDLRGRPLATYPANGGAMVFTRNGRRLVVGGQDCAFQVYDVPSGHLVKRVVSPTPALTGSWPEVVALSPDGSRLAVGYPTLFSDVGTVSVYSTTTWAKQLDVTTFPADEISAVAFSPDGTRLAVGGEDGTAGVWSLVTREQLVSYAGPTAAVTSMSFLPGGRQVLTASNDGVVRVWRALGTEQANLPVYANIDWLSVAGDTVAAVEDGNHKSWLTTYRLPSGRTLRTMQLGPFVTSGWVVSQDARYLVTYLQQSSTSAEPPTSFRAPIRIWNLASGRVVRTLPPTAIFHGVAALSPDDSRLFLLLAEPHSNNGQPEVLNLRSGHVVRPQMTTPCGYFPPGIVFSSNDSRMAASSFCGYADVWNANTGRLIRQVNEGAEISTVDLTPDGSRLLVGSWDSRATIYSVGSGRPLVQLIGHTRGIASASFAEAGRLVVTSAIDHTARVWDARTGRQLRVLTFPYDQAASAASPNGQELAFGENTPVIGADDVIRVFATCPACQSPRGLLALAAPHVPPASRLTALERTVVNGA